MTVAFKTFGCRLNRAEALDLEAAVQAAGHTVIDLPTGTGPAPDCIVVRGCSVTARAQRDCEKEIAHLQARFPHSRLVVQGCLPNAVKDPSALLRPMGTVPAGTVPGAAVVSDRTSRAYLKVQDGCSGRCAFCIVPRFRGPPRSLPFDEVLARARTCLAAGFRELVVTGCNLALYRSQGHGLADLLAALAALGTDPEKTTGTVPRMSGTVPVHRVRLGSLEPGICDADILAVFEKHANICRFIHLSLQSGSPDVLARMNRPYRLETVAAFCTEARRRLGPRLALGADVITGFPGETEADFRQTEAFLMGTGPGGFAGTGPGGFTNLHVFPYSERPGTPAATMDGALPRAVRLARARTLEQRGQALRRAFARSFLGETVEVCIERGGDHGWTAEYLPCRLREGTAPRRSLVPLRVVDVTSDGTLLGQP